MANQRILLKHKLLAEPTDGVVIGRRLGTEFTSPRAVEGALDNFHARVYDVWLDEPPGAEHYDAGYYIELEHGAGEL